MRRVPSSQPTGVQVEGVRLRPRGQVHKPMNSSVVAFRTRRGVSTLGPAEARERSIRRRVGVVWGLLVLNALTYYGSALHVPHAVGKVLTQGALPAALLVALTVNRRASVRPNVFLSLLSLLVLEAVVTTLQPQHLGTLYRFFRLVEFVAVLWLLSPWWGRRDLLLVRATWYRSRWHLAR